MIETLTLALIAGAGIALITAPLGCFVVWRRMAYFGDSLAHSALLGIALGFVFHMNAQLATILVCACFALLLVWLQQKRLLATDTLLGILTHAAFSIGLIAMSLIGEGEFDIHHYLFGDLSTVTWPDIYWIIGGLIITSALLKHYWQALVLMTLHEDLARAEGISTLKLHLLLMGLMTLVVAVALKLIGILLITSLLIIPPATARLFARSPSQMAVITAFCSILSISAGLIAAGHYGTQSGPTIVVAATILFVLLLPFGLKHQKS